MKPVVIFERCIHVKGRPRRLGISQMRPASRRRLERQREELCAHAFEIRERFVEARRPVIGGASSRRRASAHVPLAEVSGGVAGLFQETRERRGARIEPLRHRAPLVVARLLRKEVIRQRCGYWPVVIAVRDGEQWRVDVELRVADALAASRSTFGVFASVLPKQEKYRPSPCRPMKTRMTLGPRPPPRATLRRDKARMANAAARRQSAERPRRRRFSLGISCARSEIGKAGNWIKCETGKAGDAGKTKKSGPRGVPTTLAFSTFPISDFPLFRFHHRHTDERTPNCP